MTETDWSFFRERLLEWYVPENRPMPWKGIDDPYRIWLSEIILQQTRVAQGLPYYERFVAAYPTVVDLAAAPDDAVMKLWEGLGYYSRARNLLAAARKVVDDHGGRFPDTYGGLRALPGVGPYTAAAIGSFAFDLPVPVLDGNVFRILARFGNDATPIDTSAGKKHYQQRVETALGGASARRFNQAIMDFGATVCTPKAASCSTCPLASRCGALTSNRVYELPVKDKKLKKRTRYFNYLVIRAGDDYLIGRRKEKDIWQDLYEFPLLESGERNLRAAELAGHEAWPVGIPAAALRLVRSSPPYRQQLSHQTIVAVFHTFATDSLPTVGDYARTNNKKFDKLAFPRLINRFLAEKSLFLDLF